MKVKSIDVTNGLQHEHLSAEFSDFNVIIGPNGCGKSSIIELIGYSLTNKFLLPGTIDTIVRQGAENGKIVLTVQDEGDDIEITTALGRTSRKLTRGDLKITKTAEVVEYIERALLKTPVELVNEASIVRQGMLDAGLFTTQARRQQIFQRLAGMNDIEAKRKQLADAKALCTPFMLSFDLDEKKRSVADVTERLDTAKAEHAKLAETAFDAGMYDAYRALLADVDSLRKNSEESDKLQKQRESLEPVVNDAKKSMDELKQRLDTLTEQEASRRVDYELALKMVATAKEVEARERERKRLQSNLDSMGQDLAALVPVAETFDDSVIDELSSIKATAEATIANSRHIVSELSRANGCKCPVCSSDIGDPSKIVELHNSIIAEHTGIVSDASSGIIQAKNERLAWEKQLAEYRGKRTRLSAGIDNTKRTLESLGDAPEQLMDTAAAEKVIADYSTLSKTVADVRESHSTVLELYNEANSKLKVCIAGQERVQESLAALSGKETTGETIHKARTFITEYESLRSRTERLHGQISELTRQLESAQKALRDTEEKAEKAKKYKVFCDYLEFARGALHRDNFPSGKVKHFIDTVLVNADAYLEVMQAGFTVSYDNENGFVANFPERGVTMRADRLSGGEKVVFALAFRFAVNEVKSETGFLVLDEPTIHLDDLHVESVVHALDLVKKKLSGRVQLFIVTHDDRVTAVADTIVEVQKLKK